MTTIRGGRPTRTQALQTLISSSPDLSPADVHRLLGRLATDQDAPAHVRLGALRALLGADAPPPRDDARDIEWKAEP